MTDFKPGEIVDITIRGARIDKVTPDRETAEVELVVRIAAPGYVGDFISMKVLAGSVDAIRVEAVAPKEWPPVPGDLWQEEGGSRLLFAAEHRCGDRDCFHTVELVEANGDRTAVGASPPAALTGLTLVSREQVSA